MKRLNKKGFTVIELILSFSFVFVLAFGMYKLVINYRTRQNEESIMSQLNDYTNQIILTIQNDIFERTLKNIDYCILDDNVIDECIILYFNDGTNKQLSIESDYKVYNGESYPINYIVYGGIIYESSDAILLDYRVDSMLYSTDDSDDIEDTNVKIFKIDIPIYHNDLEGNHGISLVAVGYNYEEPPESDDEDPPTGEDGDNTTDDGGQTPGDEETSFVLDYSTYGDDNLIHLSMHWTGLSSDNYPLTIDFYIDGEIDNTITLDSKNFINYTYEGLEEGIYNVKAVIKNSSGVTLGEVYDSVVAYCFLAGTKVLTESGLKNIEDIKLGEMVYSLNLDTNQKELKKVTKLIRSRTYETYELTIGDSIVKTTSRHEFYIVDKGWVRAKDLQEGDVVVSTSGEDMEIRKIVYKVHGEPIDTYNLTVEDNHNYLITEDRLLVHNAASPV